MQPPKRRIFKVLQPTTSYLAAMRRGQRANVLLECGHWDSLTRTEMRIKKHYCFDCLRKKPVDALAQSLLDESVEPEGERWAA